MPYIGKAPSSGIRSRFIYTATAAQTTFTGADGTGKTLGYTDGEYVDVYLNGVLLDPADYTATSKTSVVLDSGATVSDIVEIVVYDTFSVFNGTFTGDLTVDGDTLVVDSTNNRVGIGTATPNSYYSKELVVAHGTEGGITLVGAAGTATGYLMFADGTTGNEAYRGYVGYSHSTPDVMVFGTSGAERMRILSGGGITFNGDTATANALDDYEEGTWTPAITQGWTSVSYTNSFQYGNYTKVGNMVTAWFFLRFSGTSAGNQVFVGGLPFTTPSSDNQAAHRGGAVTYFNVPVAAAGAITAYVAGGNTVIQFYAFDDGGAAADSNANASSDFLIGSVTYWVE